LLKTKPPYRRGVLLRIRLNNPIKREIDYTTIKEVNKKDKGPTKKL
jgi:hypothetical protein